MAMARIQTGRHGSLMFKHCPQDLLDRLKKSSKDDEKSEILPLSVRLFQANRNTAEKCLETGYISGIGNGKLDPNQYGGYTVQDAIYCYNTTKCWDELASRSTGDIKVMCEARQKSYKRYTEELFKQWHVSDPSGICLNAAAKTYSTYEQTVARTLHPLYGIVAMIPCSRLWYWIADKLKDKISENNVYSFWIKDNLDEHSAILLEKFIDSHAELIDETIAFDVYAKCMQGEYGFFASATTDD